MEFAPHPLRRATIKNSFLNIIFPILMNTKIFVRGLLGCKVRKRRTKELENLRKMFFQDFPTLFSRRERFLTDS
jgi:hypothetical protein